MPEEIPAPVHDTGAGRSAAGVASTLEPLLVLTSVSKAFGGIVAVANVTLTVGRGESVGLVGPNGAGKTTLFNCVCGQIRPTSGSIEFDGVQLDRLPAFRRARLGIARTFQRVEMFSELTVRGHLLVAERARRGDGRMWKDLCNLGAPCPDELSHVDSVLELVGLTPLADVPVAALGLGTCRLVELARALVLRPKLLLVDEPSSGLDAHETRELAQVLRTLQAEHGMSVLLVEHDLGMVSEVVDRVVVMDLGEVIASGLFEDVMKEPRVRAAYLGTGASSAVGMHP
jgi:branched-chain amino acid transport system ATP-binding protein